MDLNRINIYDNGPDQVVVDCNYYNNPPMPVNQKNVAAPVVNRNPVNNRTKVEIHLSCKHLPNLDSMSKTDPKLFVFIEEKTYQNGCENSNWILVGSTETVKNDLNPKFSKSFLFDYYFEYIQNFRFVLMDMDSENEGLDNNEYIGYVEKSLGELLSSSDGKVCKCDLLRSTPIGMSFKQTKKRDMNKDSKIIISIEKIACSNNSTMTLNIEGFNLDKKDIMGKSDPFFVISKALDDGSWAKVYESKVIKNTLNPKWGDIEIDVATLNSGDSNKLLKWEVFDWDKNSPPDLIGKAEASLETTKKDMILPLKNPKKKDKKDYINSGTLVFNWIDFASKYSFAEFPLNGTEISVNFAIDFTASNGAVNNELSLHYLSPTCDLNNFYTLNEYQKAIAAIGHVLEPYDSNKIFGVYGYGGIFNKEKEYNVNFDYPLNGNYENPGVPGIQGVLEAYSNTLKTVELCGPTNFAPIIKKISEIAKSDLGPTYSHSPLKKYHILTIITDGMIDDMRDTIDAIVEASELPISIIIIGVGDMDFNCMNKLDGDQEGLKSRNKTPASRDIVQFIPLKKFIDNPERLASETLAEIPKQLISFTKKFKFEPPNRPNDIPSYAKDL